MAAPPLAKQPAAQAVKQEAPQDFAARIAAHMNVEPRVRHMVNREANMLGANMTYTAANADTPSLSYSAAELTGSR